MDENIIQAAEEAALLEVDRGIKAIQRNMPKQPADFDGLCTKCDEPIPEKRVAFGAVTCIDCQVSMERRSAIRRN